MKENPEREKQRKRRVFKKNFIEEKELEIKKKEEMNAYRLKVNDI